MTTKQTSKAEPRDDRNKAVFIIHGHDELMKEKVARFVEKLGLHAIVLQEKINKGMTILEKLERCAARAGFAIALLMPDDTGYPAGREELKSARARQNVVLELGYFIGKLGRNRVCVLYRDGVELPSDIKGVVYTPLDESIAWQWALARELKEAGYDIDLNRILN